MCDVARRSDKLDMCSVQYGSQAHRRPVLTVTVLVCVLSVIITILTTAATVNAQGVELECMLGTMDALAWSGTFTWSATGTKGDLLQIKHALKGAVVMEQTIASHPVKGRISYFGYIQFADADLTIDDAVRSPDYQETISKRLHAGMFDIPPDDRIVEVPQKNAIAIGYQLPDESLEHLRRRADPMMVKHGIAMHVDLSRCLYTLEIVARIPVTIATRSVSYDGGRKVVSNTVETPDGGVWLGPSRLEVGHVSPPGSPNWLRVVSNREASIVDGRLRGKNEDRDRAIDMGLLFHDCSLVCPEEDRKRVHWVAEWELVPIRKFDLQIGAFIPHDYIPRLSDGQMPLFHAGCELKQVYTAPGVPALSSLVFRGDLKVGEGYGRPESKLFDVDSPAFRFRMKVTARSDGILLTPPEIAANASKSYAMDAVFPEGIIDDRDDDATLGDCILLHAVGTDVPQFSVEITSEAPNRIRLDVTGVGTIPILVPAAAIDLQYRIVIDASKYLADYDVKAFHDGFPAHELYINRQPVYTFDPRTVNDGPMALLPPLDRRRWIRCQEKMNCVEETLF
jgi:hypothetical protein